MVRSLGLGASDVLSAMFTWWTALCTPTAPVPGRYGLLPETLPPSAFPHLMLCEFTTDRSDLTFRIVGEHLRTYARTPWVGRRASACADPDFFGGYLLPLYQEVAATGRPIHAVNHVQKSRMQPTVVMNRLVLPLRGRSDRVDWILTTLVVDRDKSLRAAPHDVWSEARTYKEIHRRSLSPPVAPPPEHARGSRAGRASAA